MTWIIAALVSIVLVYGACMVGLRIWRRRNAETSLLDIQEMAKACRSDGATTERLSKLCSYVGNLTDSIVPRKGKRGLLLLRSVPLSHANDLLDVVWWLARVAHEDQDPTSWGKWNGGQALFAASFVVDRAFPNAPPDDFMNFIKAAKKCLEKEEIAILDPTRLSYFVESLARGIESHLEERSTQIPEADREFLRENLDAFLIQLGVLDEGK